MQSLLETPTRTCRYLSEDHFEELYKAFINAYSDYLIRFELSEEQFRSHIRANAVDLERSVGWFEGGQLIGFTLNGFGNWQGTKTVYDAGTGILPDFRKQGLSEKMFEAMLPEFGKLGYRQCLLEVIVENEKAVRLYQKLGFEVTRSLSLLHRTGEVSERIPADESVELRDIETHDWAMLKTFWDGQPSWQNTPEAIARSQDKKRTIGTYFAGRLVGYIVYSTNVGRVAQIAVDRKFRNRCIGTRLLNAMIAETPEGFVPQVINIDRSVESAMRFFENSGFTERLTQYEMLRAI